MHDHPPTFQTSPGTGTPAPFLEEEIPRAPAARPRLHPLLRAGLFLIVYVAVHLLVLMLLGILAQGFSGRFFQEGGFGRSSEFLLVTVALTAPPMVAVTVFFVRSLDRRPIVSLGVRWPVGGPPVALRQLVTLPLATLALLGAWLAAVLALPPSLAKVGFGGTSEVFASGPSWWPLPPVLLLPLLLLGFLVQGGLEEWIVRGYVYRALKDLWQPWAAALASSILFSFLHATNPNISAVALVNIVLAGMILAALVERSGSLWGATLAHGVWNFSVACLLSAPVSGFEAFHLFDVSFRGDDLLTGGEFGPEGSLVLTAFGILLTAALWGRRQSRERPTAP
ncbi:MAG TPA: CPBP family intramembrane glutamic endopeptidase [Thermoanaerobaculia bacterium]|nr:CPBP family intramembrane glutamic endopeptidase [Thermoanaerobaculia bacterium]